MKHYNIYRYSLLIGIFLVLTLPLIAQQKPVFSQYMMDKYLVNPAFAGNSGYSVINFTARQQYMNFYNPPRTFIISAQTRLLEDSWILRNRPVRKKNTKASRNRNIGIGGLIYNDRNGIISRTGFQLTYAYHIDFNSRYQLSFGLSACGFQYKLDDSKAWLTNKDDPLLLGTQKTFFVPDANCGIFLSGQGLYAGVSVSELFGSYVKLGKNKIEDYKTLRHFYLLSGYKFAAGQSVIIEPSFLLQTTVNDFQADISTRIFYLKNYWLGVTYRTNKTCIAMAGLALNQFYLGYAYDMTLSSLRTYSGGTHEIMAGIRLGDNNTRRFRWLMPDVSEKEQ
jgi:type IX secretion system PorP/SprF family membrane protein